MYYIILLLLVISYSQSGCIHVCLCFNSFDKQVFLVLWEPCGILVILANHAVPSAPAGPRNSKVSSVAAVPAVSMTILQKRPLQARLKIHVNAS